MPLDTISIRGAREHNLKGFDLDIPRDQLVVITGLSGSGKSSLAFDTIYAEGQRRYVESLSAYARQFLGQMDKPDVDHIEGLSPAVSIDQKTTSKNPRSTVGTVTEIYDYLRLLYARVGIPHCPICGRPIERQTSDQIVDRIFELASGTKFLVLAPVVRGRKGEYGKLLDDLKREGFTRVRVDKEMRELSEEIVLDKKYKHDIDVVVDRLVMKEGARGRLAESVELGLRLSAGTITIAVVDGDELSFSQALACPVHGVSMDELAPRDFSFNSPYGACPDCVGLGSRLEPDTFLVVPDPTLSLAQGAIKPFSIGQTYYPQLMAAAAKHLGVSTDTPWEKLPKRAQNALLSGLGDERIRIDYVTRDGRETHWYSRYEGALQSVMRRYKESESEGVKEKLEEFMSVIPCNTCKGARLKPEILAVTFGSRNISEITTMSAKASLGFFKGVELTEREETIARRVIKEIVERLRFLVDVGLDYLTLDRGTASLSGGEAQRIRLATQIGSGLMGVLYILDEPSIGLHQRDNARLIATLERLRDLGNTVIVVEHDEETIRAADFVVDMGPGAGEHGGEIVCTGPPEATMACPESLTGAYLTGRKSIPLPETRRDGDDRGAVRVLGAEENNLRGIDVEFPIGQLTVVTGVSGSGKSSLVADTLAPALSNAVHRARKRTGRYRKLEGVELIDKVIDIDQSPIGRTPRSNPATYTGLWDDVRSLFSSTPEAKTRGYSPGRFSFNVMGGRCEACKGDGQIKIEMHFLPDVYVPCEVCKGARYNRETLQVTYKGKTVSDVLGMSAEEALHFFENIPPIRRKLQTLYDVGLGYIKLGQPATTLSGGEAQRVKLSSELQRRSTGRTFYILDEPTTGLHFDDVRQLLVVL
ncbi:MAG: excinuclease ABC subunit UvrA, partial [Coriobacteriaceae bacterium]|nr:excinuclease ABC subunit UvrA [Coriobacteriaceae bacterium]